MNNAILTSPAAASLDENKIRVRAYYLWLERGSPPNQELEIWHAAKALLHDRSNPAPQDSRESRAARERTPLHHFHNPSIAHDKRTDVAASGSRQRIRARDHQG